MFNNYGGGGSRRSPSASASFPDRVLKPSAVRPSTTDAFYTTSEAPLYRPSVVDDVISRYVLENIANEKARSSHHRHRSTTPPSRSTPLTPTTSLAAAAMQRRHPSPIPQRKSRLESPSMIPPYSGGADGDLADLRQRVGAASVRASEVAHTAKDLEKSRTLLAELEDENLQLRSRVRSLALLVEEKEQSIKDLENNLRSAKLQSQELEETRMVDSSHLRKQLQTLQQENADLVLRCDSLRHTLAAAKEEESLTRGVGNHRDRLQQLELQLETSRSTNHRLSSQLEEREARLAELMRLQGDLPRLESEAEDALSRYRALQRRTQGLEEDRTREKETFARQLRSIHYQLEAVKQEAASEVEQASSATAVNEEQKARHKQNEQELLDDLQDSIRRVLDQVRAQQREAKNLRLDIDAIRQENKSLKEAANAKEVLLHEATALKMQLHHLEENISHLQLLNADLKKTVEKKEEASAADLTTYLNEIEQLRNDLNKGKKDLEKLEVLKKENANLRQQIANHDSGTTEKLIELRAEKNVLEGEVSELREKLIGMTANAIQVERIFAEQIDELQRDVATLRAKEADCKANHFNEERERLLQARQSQLDEENEQLRARMDANRKLQSSLELERQKEQMKRDQQLSLQDQLQQLTFFSNHPARPASQSAKPVGSSATTTSLSSPSAPYRPSPPLPMITAVSDENVASPNAPQVIPTGLALPPVNASQAHLKRMERAGTGVPQTSNRLEDGGNTTPRSALINNGSRPQSSPNSPRSNTTSGVVVMPRATPIASQFAIPQQEGIESIRYADTGVASIRFAALPILFEQAAHAGQHNVAIRTELTPNGPTSSPQYTPHFAELTWHSYYQQAVNFGKGLVSHRLDPYSAVLLIADGCAELAVSYMGSILAGCLPVASHPLHPTPFLIRQIEETSAEVIVVDDVQLLQRLLTATKRLKCVKQFVLLHVTVIPQALKLEYGQMIATFEQFSALANYVSEPVFQRRIMEQYVDRPAVIAYTPGTTAEPKAVVLSHDNLQFSAAAFAEAMVLTDSNGVNHLNLSSFGDIYTQVQCIILPILTLASRGTPFVVNFMQPGSSITADTLRGHLRAVRPTYLCAPPQVYDELKTLILAAAEEGRTETDKKLVLWAHSVARESSFHRQRNGTSGGNFRPLEIPQDAAFQSAVAPSGDTVKGSHLAASINDKIKASLGLETVVQTIVLGGAAPLSLLERFAAFGFDLLQLYNLTEATGAVTVSSEAKFRFGTSGFRLPGTDIRVDTSVRERSGFREGEILIRGRHVMIGYLLGNRTTVDQAGWYRTGDLGRLDEATEIVTVDGRLKDSLVVLPTGDPMNASPPIAPMRLEMELLQVCPALSRVAVFGDHQQCLVALFTLKTTRNPQTGTYTDQLRGEALEVNPNVLTVQTARRDAVWLRYISGIVAQCNSVADHPFAKIKRFCILPHDFSIMGGELTANEKVKRHAVGLKFSALLQRLFAETKPAAES